MSICSFELLQSPDKIPLFSCDNHMMGIFYIQVAVLIRQFCFCRLPVAVGFKVVQIQLIKKLITFCPVCLSELGMRNSFSFSRLPWQIGFPIAFHFEFVKLTTVQLALDKSARVFSFCFCFLIYF